MTEAEKGILIGRGGTQHKTIQNWMLGSRLINHPKMDGINHPKLDGINHPKMEGINHPKLDDFSVDYDLKKISNFEWL